MNGDSLPDDAEEGIRARAYEIWESEGRPHGRHLDHWFRSEREIRVEAPAKVKPKKRSVKAAAPDTPKKRRARVESGADVAAPGF